MVNLNKEFSFVCISVKLLLCCCKSLCASFMAFLLNSSFRFQFRWIWITCRVVIERIVRRALHGYFSASDRCYGRVFDMNGSHASKISGFSDQLKK